MSYCEYRSQLEIWGALAGNLFRSQDAHVEFFDSYGQDPSKYPTVMSFLQKYGGAR